MPSPSFAKSLKQGEFRWTPLMLNVLPRVAQEVDEVIRRYKDLLSDLNHFDGEMRHGNPDYDPRLRQELVDQVNSVKDAIKARMQELEGFYFEHQNDGRAILFEKQRMKLRACLQAADGTSSPQRTGGSARSNAQQSRASTTFFPSQWMPLRGSALPEVHAEVNYVCWLCEELLATLERQPDDEALWNRLIVYRQSVETRIAAFQGFFESSEEPSLVSFLAREQRVLTNLAKQIDDAIDRGAPRQRPAPARDGGGYSSGASSANRLEYNNVQSAPVRDPPANSQTSTPEAVSTTIRKRGTSPAHLVGQKPTRKSTAARAHTPSRNTVVEQSQSFDPRKTAKGKAPLVEFRVRMTAEEHEELMRRKAMKGLTPKTDSPVVAVDAKAEKAAAAAAIQAKSRRETTRIGAQVPQDESTLGDIFMATLQDGGATW